MQRLTQDQVTRRMGARPDTIYRLVSDVTRTPSWSPEVAECRWLDGATQAAVGARFAATNRRRWLTWTNRPVVTQADPGRCFAIERTEHGGGTLRWTYTLTPAGTAAAADTGTATRADASTPAAGDQGTTLGTDVTLSYQVLKPVPVMLHIILRLFLHCPDLKTDLHRNLQASLARIDALTDADTDPDAATVTDPVTVNLSQTVGTDQEPHR